MPADLTCYVYDMDGVITTKNCFFSYLGKRLLSSPSRLLRASPALLRMTRAKDYDTKMDLGFAITAAALKGLTLDEYEDQARSFGQRLAREPGRLQLQVISELRAQHAAGAHIVIATACEHTRAQSVLAAADVPYGSLSATRFAQSADRIVVSDPRVGQRKAQALMESGLPLSQAEFYTDDASDLPTVLPATQLSTRRTNERGRNTRPRTTGEPNRQQRPTP